jgi:predicted DNA-binding transcriptional regulator AlpA
MQERMQLSVTPRYAPISDWCALTGMGRSSVYEALGRGDLKAIKLGVRTLIDVEHGLAWLASMPAAEITTGRTRRSTGGPETNEAAEPRQ